MAQLKFPMNTLAWLKQKDESYLENAFGSELVNMFKKRYTNDLKRVDNTHSRFVESMYRDLRMLSEVNIEAKMLIDALSDQWRAEKNVFANNQLPTLPPKPYDVHGFKELSDIEGYPVEKTCPICLEDYSMDDKVAITKCNHSFHEHCIEKQVKCPLCRDILNVLKNQN